MMFYYDLIVIGDLIDNLSTIASALSLNARVGFLEYQSDHIQKYLTVQSENIYNKNINYHDFIEQKNNQIKYKYRPELEKKGVDFLAGQYHFEVENKRLFLRGKKKNNLSDRVYTPSYLLNADRHILFSSSSPSSLINEKIITVDQLIKEDKWQNLPDNVAIVGSQISTIYLAQKLLRSNTNTTISLYTENESLLPCEDEDISWELQLHLEAKGLKIYKSRSFLSNSDQEDMVGIINNHDLVITDFEENELLETKQDNLGLQTIGLKFDRYGVRVNSKMQTHNPHIFACGDILGGYNAESILQQETETGVFNALFGGWRKINYYQIPYSLKTSPSIYRLGYTGKQARMLMLFGDSTEEISLHPRYSSGEQTALGDNPPIFYLKIILDSQQRILGVHCLGEMAEFIAVITTIFQENKPFSSLFKASFNQEMTHDLVKQIWDIYYYQHNHQNNHLAEVRKTFLIWKQDLFK